jgi:hypothetical protein
MAKKPGIPVVNVEDRTVTMAFAAIKENIELITGARAGSSEISSLATDSDTATIINKINEIIRKINYSG